jgi:hypothetical protein
MNYHARDLGKAEMLVRKSLSIRTQFQSQDNVMIGYCVGLLASILISQGRVDSETKEMHERSLAISTINYGSEGKKTAISTYLMDFSRKENT